jgi:hypothetical protein
MKEENMPVRTVSNRGGNIIGKFPSLKMGRMIAFESLLERDFIYLLDYDANVEWFEEQPLTIEYPDEGKIRHYTPDFHLLERGERILVECKPECFTDQDENRQKFAAAREWCSERRWTFRVVTDQEVHAGFRLHNVKLLTRYARQPMDPILRRRVYALLRGAQHPMRMNDLARVLAPDAPTTVIGSILHLAFRHEICVPMEDLPLSGETLVCLNDCTPKETTT